MGWTRVVSETAECCEADETRRAATTLGSAALHNVKARARIRGMEQGMKGSGTVRVGGVVVQGWGHASQELAGAPRPAGEAQGERECGGQVVGGGEGGEGKEEAGGIRCR